MEARDGLRRSFDASGQVLVQTIGEAEAALRWRKLDAEHQRLDRLTGQGADDAPPAVDLHFADLCAVYDGPAAPGRWPAVMERTDGETVLYANKLNVLHGPPGSGKTWIALEAISSAVDRGGHAAYLDHEDSYQTFKQRCQTIGINLEAHADAVKYVRPGLAESPAAMAEALLWLSNAPEPGQSLVVIDSAETAGCPSDGSDVKPWYRDHVDPWIAAHVGVLLLDHVPKAKEGRPMGQIGSQHKRARLTGASLDVSGVPWTKRASGKLYLRNHKDRPGDLPAAIGKTVAVILGTYDANGAFRITVEPPKQEDNADIDLPANILRSVADAGPGGVVGRRAMRKLVEGSNGLVDSTTDNLVDNGLLAAERMGKATAYTITDDGLGLISEALQ